MTTANMTSSGLPNNEASSHVFAPKGSELASQPLPSVWETLCGWLTRALRGMITTIERRTEEGEWVVDCQPNPLESVSTRQTANGVRVISIAIRMSGECKVFEITGTNNISLRRNAAGWPVKVDFGYDKGQLVLLFSGEKHSPQGLSSNAWGE